MKQVRVLDLRLGHDVFFDRNTRWDCYQIVMVADSDDIDPFWRMAKREELAAIEARILASQTVGLPSVSNT